MNFKVRELREHVAKCQVCRHLSLFKLITLGECVLQLCNESGEDMYDDGWRNRYATLQGLCMCHWGNDQVTGPVNRITSDWFMPHVKAVVWRTYSLNSESRCWWQILQSYLGFSVADNEELQSTKRRIEKFSMSLLFSILYELQIIWMEVHQKCHISL